jgi:hypothetical protein
MMVTLAQRPWVNTVVELAHTLVSHQPWLGKPRASMS